MRTIIHFFYHTSLSSS